jgi:transcriptional regulator with XRE-family HTH domain
MSRLKKTVKAALAKEGYTVADLARRMEIHQSSLSKYLRGDMRMDTALRIARSLALSTTLERTSNEILIH